MSRIRAKGRLAVCFAAMLSAVQGVAGQSAERAIALQQSGDLEGAVREYRAYLAEHPAEGALRSNLGVVLSRLGRYEEAIGEYTEALKTNPGNPGIELNLALAYYKMGRIPEAAEHLEGIHNTAQANGQVVLLLADCYLRMGENRRVIELLRPVHGQQPNDRAIAYVLGMALIGDHQLAEGQKVIDPILKDPDLPESHFLLGAQMFAKGNYPGAVKEFGEASAAAPDLPSLQSYLGQALLNTGDPDGAGRAFRKELARDPNDFYSNLRLAEILKRRGKTEEAAPLFERASRVRPGSAEVDQAKSAGPQPEKSPLTGSAAPDFTLAALGAGRNVALRSYRGKPVVLVFGSYSCPNFRTAAPSLVKLYSKYGKQTQFLMVYIREAHSTDEWQSTRNQKEGIVLAPPATMAAKSAYAGTCVRKLSIPFAAVVDGLDNQTEKAYSAWPSHAYLLDAEGVVRFSTGLTELDYHAEQLEAAIRGLMK